MKIVLNGDVEIINQEVKRSNGVVAIWGAGTCATSFLCDCGYTGRFDYFVDANKMKWNTKYLNKNIY